eukprot:4379820-Alexandrium_andersonii.AAC.1
MGLLELDPKPGRNSQRPAPQHFGSYSDGKRHFTNFDSYSNGKHNLTNTHKSDITKPPEASVARGP